LLSQIYVITDENRLAIATSVSTYQTSAKEGEGSGGVDGGSASSVFTAEQSINGGGA
jgi:hypothetical protein